VAGAAAVVRQYLREEADTASPSAALVKAILVSAARRLPSRREHDSPEDVGYPDFDQGFGLLDLATILPTATASPRRKLVFTDVANDAPEALESRAELGGPRRALRAYRVTVPDGATEPLTVTLAWTDPPGVFVQNLLRLDVTPPDGRFLIGNPELRYHRDALFDDPTPGGIPPDTHNNVQRVRVDTPAADEYRIRVLARNTSLPPQGYALAVCGELTSGLETDA
jgi:serine protease AprX